MSSSSTTSHLWHSDGTLLSSKDQEWNLIYKGTRDGFSVDDFHRCCDKQGPTITVIRTKEGDYLFGGYTSVPWYNTPWYDFLTGESKADPHAFLFTLRNPH